MNNVMVDIETFGTDSNSVIVSISAVKFDINTGELGSTFEIGLDIQEQLDNGAVIDGSTVMWWLEQSKEAQHELTRIDRIDVASALSHFNSFLYPTPDALWGNGATFDNVIVRNLHKRHKIEFRVPFWADRCVRTYVDMNDINTRDFKFVGTKHNGIDDCLHQIKYMTTEVKNG